MVEPDFESIIRKYRSLVAGPPSQKASGAADLPLESKKNDVQDEIDSVENSLHSFGSEDDFIDKDRFVRAPIAPPDQNEHTHSNLEYAVFNNLFTSVDIGDEFNQLANQERFFKDDGDQIDLFAADLAKRLYQHEMDLRQNYNPGLGIYPGQALYSPSSDRFKHKSKEEPSTQKDSFELPEKESKLDIPQEVYDFIARTTKKKEDKN